MASRKTLTSSQISWLSRITAKGIAAYALLGLKGRAKQYESRYRASLSNAVAAHNDGVATNSPLSSNIVIEAGPFGPKGGQGYRLAAIEPLVEVAEKACKDNDSLARHSP